MWSNHRPPKSVRCPERHHIECIHPVTRAADPGEAWPAIAILMFRFPCGFCAPPALQPTYLSVLIKTGQCCQPPSFQHYCCGYCVSFSITSPPLLSSMISLRIPDGRPEPRDLDSVLAELALLMARGDLFFTFARRRYMVGPFTVSSLSLSLHGRSLYCLFPIPVHALHSQSI